MSSYVSTCSPADFGTFSLAKKKLSMLDREGDGEQVKQKDIQTRRRTGYPAAHVEEEDDKKYTHTSGWVGGCNRWRKTVLVGLSDNKLRVQIQVTQFLKTITRKDSNGNPIHFQIGFCSLILSLSLPVAGSLLLFTLSSPIHRRTKVIVTSSGRGGACIASILPLV